MALYESFCLEISDYMNMTEGIQKEHSSYKLPNAIRRNCQHPCYREIQSFKCTSAQQQSGNSPLSVWFLPWWESIRILNYCNIKCNNCYQNLIQASLNELWQMIQTGVAVGTVHLDFGALFQHIYRWFCEAFQIPWAAYSILVVSWTRKMKNAWCLNVTDM